MRLSKDVSRMRTMLEKSLFKGKLEERRCYGEEERHLIF